MRRPTIKRPVTSEAGSFRLPMAVSEVYLFRNGDAYPVCPRCRITLEREYQAYCDRCGQALDWSDYEKALVVLVP